MAPNNSPFFGSTARVSTNRLDGNAKDTGGSYTGTSKSTSSGALDRIKAIANNALNPAEQDTGNNPFESSTSTGVLIFDNAQHSADGGGTPIDGRSTGDEAANVYREFDALDINVTATAATDGNTLAQLLANVAAFVLPEAEGGNVFPDADTVFRFVDDGGNLLFFGGSGFPGSQLNYINDTFGLNLTAGGAGGNYPLSPDALDEFLGGPDHLGSPSATDYIDMGSLPDDAVVIYGREADAETVLAFLPTGEGQLVFLGWDYFDSFGQDDGWDAAFEIVADLTTTIEIAGVASSNPDIGTPFWDLVPA